ncbi:transmembrane protein, putative [Medicago truncatula]|uniref:Transmembrane protein, putative n=1 Tax=Medicago truncatula TaxID=3880 RepID=G7L4S4_MEDTR|nr:transmembrane protein, putative [Medicago truncatula]
MPHNNQIPVQISAVPDPTNLSQNPYYIHPNEMLESGYEAWELCNNLDHVWILNPVNLPLHTNLASKSWTDLNSLMQIAFTFQIFSEIYAIGSKITFLLVIISLKFISGSSVVNGQVTAQLAFVITITVFWHLVKVHIR